MDFVLAYPHARAEVPLYMRFPKGYEFKDGISEDTHVLKLTKNIYGQKQAGRVWNKYLDEGLGEIGFKPSKMDPCLYFHGRIALLVYIDNCIMFSPDMVELDKVVEEMRRSSKKFRVEDLATSRTFGNSSYERKRQNNHIEPAATNQLYPEGHEISEQHKRERYTSFIIGHSTKGHTRQTIQQ